MNLKPMTRTQLQELVEILQPDDLRWLRNLLDDVLDNQPLDKIKVSSQPESVTVDDNDEPLPENATLDEAIELYLADKCSLGRASQLAGVTRWHIMDELYERGIPTNGNHDFTPEEYETMFDIREELLHGDHK